MLLSIMTISRIGGLAVGVSLGSPARPCGPRTNMFPVRENHARHTSGGRLIRLEIKKVRRVKRD